MTDAVNIKDAFIVNIGIDYEIILLPNAVGRDVLLKCSNRCNRPCSILHECLSSPLLGLF